MLLSELLTVASGCPVPAYSADAKAIVGLIRAVRSETQRASADLARDSDRPGVDYRDPGYLPEDRAARSSRQADVLLVLHELAEAAKDVDQFRCFITPLYPDHNPDGCSCVALDRLDRAIEAAAPFTSRDEEKSK